MNAPTPKDFVRLASVLDQNGYTEQADRVTQFLRRMANLPSQGNSMIDNWNAHNAEIRNYENEVRRSNPYLPIEEQDALIGQWLQQTYPDLIGPWRAMNNMNRRAPAHIEHVNPYHGTGIHLRPHDPNAPSYTYQAAEPTRSQVAGVKPRSLLTRQAGAFDWKRWQWMDGKTGGDRFYTDEERRQLEGTPEFQNGHWREIDQAERDERNRAQDELDQWRREFFGDDWKEKRQQRQMTDNPDPLA